jgi:hypothetical protein
MNTPKMPGFTAEASMYKSSERYHALAAVSRRQTNGGISPQFRMVAGNARVQSELCLHFSHSMPVLHRARAWRTHHVASDHQEL